MGIFDGVREDGILGLRLMQRGKALGVPANCLIRTKHNRCQLNSGKPWERTCAGESLGQVTFTMPSRHGIKER